MLYVNAVCVCVQVVVNGDKNFVVLRYLNSLTEYQITVFAIYSNAASEALRGSETTCECAWSAITSDLYNHIRSITYDLLIHCVIYNHIWSI